MKAYAHVFAMMLASTGAACATDTAPMLRPGEIGLHIVTHGSVRTPADIIMLSAPLTADAATATAARTAANERAVRITAALVARGVDRSAIAGSRLRRSTGLAR